MTAGKTRKKRPFKFRPALFWDANLETIDPRRHARYIIERVLEFGKDKEVRGLFQYYPFALIRETFKESRGVIHEKSRALWSLILR